jgi:hypothetical protein
VVFSVMYHRDVLIYFVDPTIVLAETGRSSPFSLIGRLIALAGVSRVDAELLKGMIREPSWHVSNFAQSSTRDGLSIDRGAIGYAEIRTGRFECPHN